MHNSHSPWAYAIRGSREPHPLTDFAKVIVPSPDLTDLVASLRVKLVLDVYCSFPPRGMNSMCSPRWAAPVNGRDFRAQATDPIAPMFPPYD